MEENRFRILHIFSGYGGGISSLVLNLISHKSSDFVFDVMAFSFSNGESFVKAIENAGGRCIQMPRPKKKGYRSFISFLDDVLFHGNYNAVHCHITGYAAVVFQYFAKKHHVSQFYLHAHTTRYDSCINRVPLINIVNKKINRKIADAFFTCSDLAAEYIFGDCSKGKKPLFLIPNGIDEEKYSCSLTISDKEKYNKEFNVQNEKTIIVIHVGRFTFPKNHDFILRIAEELKKTCVTFRIIMVGDGELFDSFRGKVKERGLDDVFTLTGRRQDIPLLMQYANVGILPSLREGLPTVAIECQASGTPMIISDTVTRQCDMNMGLVEFVTTDNPACWADRIRHFHHHIPVEMCIETIRANHFTAKTASDLYCNYIRKLLLN